MWQWRRKIPSESIRESRPGHALAASSPQRWVTERALAALAASAVALGLRVMDRAVRPVGPVGLVDPPLGSHVGARSVLFQWGRQPRSGR